MVDVTLDYPEDIEMVFRHGRLTSLQILDAGWAKLEAAGWPTKGQAMPINLALCQDETGNLTVIVSTDKQ